jgi:heat shock protein HtpX
MNLQSNRLPSRKWSILALGTTGMTAVLLSYLIAMAVAVAFLSLPYIIFVIIPFTVGNLIFMRLLLSAFGLVAGFTILWSLIPRRAKVEINGVLIDLSKETRLSGHLEEIAAALKEPMPSEVYLIGDANAFVTEAGGFAGIGRRRIMGLGLPLLQMLTIAQFRAVIAHEFAHYYAGDTRLGPWVYNTRQTMSRVYQNLGRKSEVMSFLTRYAVVAPFYIMLMGGMRVYWKLFMRLTQLISRRQEYRSDELACYIAGSEPLIAGLENIHRCQAALRAYWNSVVVPVAVVGFQPQVANGFLRFMNAPHIARATSDSLAKQIAEETTDPFDTHPPLNKRIDAARRMNLPAPDSPDRLESDLPMISLIDGLDSLEAKLLKKFIPALADAELKPMTWDSAGTEVYVPTWRKRIESFLPLFSAKTLSDLPSLVTKLKALSDKIPSPPGVFLEKDQRDARALELLSWVLALSLLDHGWKLVMEPGTFLMESGEHKLEPAAVIGAMKAGKLTCEQWESQCLQFGVSALPMAPLFSLEATS